MHLLGDLLLLLYIFTFLNGTFPLKNVELDIEPRVVQKGESSTLTCMYEIDGAQLYTVKWYRGIHEFYRYTPSELPSTKIFFTKGIHIDLESSTEHQVVLRDVGFTLTGNFSCEVTTEEPYTTASASKDMLVVVFPESPPSLVADKSFYLIGDILKANCTSPPSRPAVSLTYFMNNVAVCEKCETKKHPAENDLFWSELTLELPLFPSHFNGNRLALRCVAQIVGIYQQGTELKLDDTKDPVPERVTSPNRAATPATITNWRCSLGIFLYLVLIFR